MPMPLASMESFNVKFVAEVEKHPVLYDYTVPEYSRIDLSHEAWTEVSKAVNLTVNECKDKWKNLRTTFVRKLKLLTSGNSKSRKPYYLHEAMEFTIPFLKTISLPTPDEDSEASHPWEMSAQEIIPKLESPDTPEEPDSPSQSPLSPQTPQQNLQHAQPTSDPSYASSSMPHLTRAQDEYSERQELSHSETESASGKNSYRKRKTEDGVDIEKIDVDHFVSKKAKIASCGAEFKVEDKKEISVRQFLNSQVLDLMTMTDVQLRLYKRRSLALIDEILGTNQT